MQNSLSPLVLAAACGACFAPLTRAQVFSEWETRTLSPTGVSTSAMDLAVGPAGEVYTLVDDTFQVPFGGSVPRASVLRFDQNGALWWGRVASLHSTFVTGSIEAGDGFVFAAG